MGQSSSGAEIKPPFYLRPRAFFPQFSSNPAVNPHVRPIRESESFQRFFPGRVARSRGRGNERVFRRGEIIDGAKNVAKNATNSPPRA